MSQKDQSKWSDRLLAPNDSYCNMPNDTSVASGLDIKVYGRQVVDGSATSAYDSIIESATKGSFLQIAQRKDLRLGPQNNLPAGVP
ncbi:unnamed protein product [Clonostachys solani]|uniref:Uncharacterized protein n=1 Tax=Clonostachys solani TaxID=160281 RepID=A0A9N9ZPJ6_9HYPO|nr:unnamed protein product [Clonostachys solani]